MKLKELLTLVDIQELADYLVEKDKNTYQFDPHMEVEACMHNYGEVIAKLKEYAKQDCPPGMPIIVERYNDKDQSYIDVSLLNTNYETPPEGAKPWGGEDFPEGYYNVNLDKYNQHFAFGFGNWKRHINSEVIDKVGLSNTALLAEILWEMTFYGFDEEEQDQRLVELDRRIADYKENGASAVIPIHELAEDQEEK